jgi:hypothetical protein
MTTSLVGWMNWLLFFFCLLAMPQLASAQQTELPCFGIKCLLPPKKCQESICFSSAQAQANFEKENNCRFGDQCGVFFIQDKDTFCCGKDVTTGSDTPVNKVQAQLNPSFDWENYKKQCPNMRQSEGAPNAVWAQCVVGQKHNASDDYVVDKVEKNGNSRSYCIDGCSTPPDIVKNLTAAGIFIFANKDNPTGEGPGGYGKDSSFYGSCALHDKCYQTCDGNNQRTCDDRLLANMLAVCNRIPAGHITTFINNLGFEDDENTRDKCRSAANKMHTGLRTPFEASKAAFKLRRQQYCQCC